MIGGGSSDLSWVTLVISVGSGLTFITLCIVFGGFFAERRLRDRLEDIETRARTLEAAVSADKRPRIAADLTRLVGTGATDMGALFKAMAISAPHITHLPGFRP